jgi:ribonuclease D
MVLDVHWCRENADLERWLERVGSGPLALDLEADSLHHYPEKICLVQLSFGETHLLLDPLAGLDLGRLAPALGDRALRKILHGADYDLRLLRRDHGLEVGGLFDTMVAARLVGETTFGLAALLDRFFGVKLDKRLQRADWSRRPLTEEMERYAVLDTRYLAELARRLEARLEELGRAAWMREEMMWLESVGWSGADDERDGFRRLKGAGALDRRGLAVLRELVSLREKAARAADRPPFRILHNEALVRIAEVRPKDQRSLDRVTRGGRRGRSALQPRDILTAVERALSLPAAELPSRATGRRPRVEPAQQQRINDLLRRRERLAGELGIDASVLAPRAVIEEAARREAEGGNPSETPKMRSWQWGMLAPLFSSGAS